MINWADLDALEALLVHEFRLSQALLRLTQSECQALMQANTPQLLTLAEQKEHLLDQLANAGLARNLSLAFLAHLPSSSDLQYPDERSRLSRLAQGIQTLTAQVRQQSQVNSLLAASALDQSAGQQAGLLSEARRDLPALFATLLDRPNNAPQAPPQVVESMVNLYHQENAYRAVIKGSTRLLAIE